jgi:hypothetical protein
MKKILILFTFVCLLVSCSTTKKISDNTTDQNSTSVKSDHDGSSYDKAIIIKEKTESAGIAAEYAWLRNNYPGYTFKRQSLNYQKEKPYDILNIVTSQGEEKSIYFDISNFFGNY